MIKLDMQSRRPIYEQLKEQILKLSMLGILSADEKLPSVRSLAREVGINPNTVQKAYEELEGEGLIKAVQGKGYIVNAQDTEMIKEQHMRLLEQHLQNAIDSSKLAGASLDEMISMLKVLYTME